MDLFLPYATERDLSHTSYVFYVVYYENKYRKENDEAS